MPPPNPERWGGPEPRGSGPVAPSPPDAGGKPKWGRLPCALRGQTRLWSPKARRGFLPLRDHLAERVWPAPARSSPSSPGQLAVRQSVPNSVHTRRLPAPAGSSSRAGQEVWPPPHEHTPSLSSAPLGGSSGRRADPPAAARADLHLPSHPRWSPAGGRAAAPRPRPPALRDARVRQV